MRFILSWIFLAITCIGPAFSADDAVFLFSRREARTIKEQVTAKDPRIMPVVGMLRREAERCMNAGPWSVTYHRPTGTAAGPHDFFSEGPYWWPDPAHPDGRYIRRDGEVNPDRFTDNDRDLSEMSRAVFTLGMAAWLFDESRYADRAAKILSVWFVDEATRMNPSLEFGQAIRNVTPGRGIGIIDTVPLFYALQGMALLEESGRWKPEDVRPVRSWFSDYLNWLTRSKKGLDEKMNGNNHSTWWSVQVAGYAIFTGSREVQASMWDFYRSYLIPHQMRPDGSCPAEEARTKSLGYSAMNLNGFALLCRLAELRGVDLWHFRAANGAGMQKAVAYLAPFVEHPEKWKKSQIQRFEGSHAFFLALAGSGFATRDYIDSYRKLRSLDGAWPLLLELILGTLQ